jgi:hypothetical protein
MSLSTEQQNLINRMANICKLAVEQLQPVISEINAIWNASGGPASTIQQADLNSVSAYSGLTTTQLNNAQFGLNSTLLTALNSAQGSLEVLAALSTGVSLPL